MKTVSGLILFFVLCGCSTQSQLMVGPAGFQRCSSAGYGLIGITVAHHSFNNCVEDMQKLGYLPIEEAGFVEIRMANSAPNVVSITMVTPNSPASQAGILLGDQLADVNGQPVIDIATAKTMMFGKAGETVNLTIRRNGADMVVPVKRAVRIPEQGTDKS